MLRLDGRAQWLPVGCGDAEGWGGASCVTAPAGRAFRKDRSPPLELFRKWADWPGIQWHSLQVGSRAADLNHLNLAEKITDWGSRFRDFSDTARVVSQLDLVISVGTAVAHLAGALGKPVWTLHPFAAEWRWMLGREDSPWYPSMRLFRQPAPGDWKGLLQRVRSELAALSRQDRRATRRPNPHTSSHPMNSGYGLPFRDFDPPTVPFSLRQRAELPPARF